jgi:hypothetical protein
LRELNQKLRTDLLGEKHRNEQLKIRLDKSESLVITLGTSNSVRGNRTIDREHKEDGSDQESSSDDDEDEDGGEDEDGQEQSSPSSEPSEDGQEGTEESGADQNMSTSPDLRATRTDSKEGDKGKDTAPTNMSSYREALKAPKERRSHDSTIGTSSGTETAPNAHQAAHPLLS